VIAETDTTGSNLNADLSLAGRGDFAFHQFEVGTWFRDYGNSHLWHGALPCGSQF
jgi:hypothetical protein